MINHLNLSDVGVFRDDEVSDFKHQNFIYGKNGTGKSTITRLIQEQASDENEVVVFQGFHSVVSRIDNGNEKLNTISLGIENVELQPSIDNMKVTISELEKQVDKESEISIYSQYKKSEESYQKAQKNLDTFYTSVAGKLKNNYQNILNDPSYNRIKLKQDALSGKELSSEEIKQINIVVKQQQLHPVKANFPPVLDTNKYLQSISEITSESVTESVALNFLDDGQRNWVREGLDMHHSEGICLFCGSTVSDERMKILNSYFNDAVKKLEVRIKKGGEIIQKQIDVYRNISLLDNRDFYPNFEGDITVINLSIERAKHKTIGFLTELQNLLNKKNNNLFEEQKLEKEHFFEWSHLEDDWRLINTKLAKVIAANNKYGNNLNNQIVEAKKSLKFHLVAKELNNEEHAQLRKIESEEKYKFDTYDMKLNDIYIDLEKKQKELSKLLSQTKDETLAASLINEKLRKLGNQSIRLVVDDYFGKGNYVIENMEGDRRDVFNLSSGELNLIGFLYFMIQITNESQNDLTPRIFVFDDPMTSNDDTSQYLIMSELKQLMMNMRVQDQLFILTHNIHFYINVRYGWWEKKLKNNRKTLHFRKTGVYTDIIPILTKDKDLKTGYDGLWEELKWLYNKKKPGYMLNPIRRILETFLKFEGITATDFYSDDEEARKYFDVNSHSLDELEADLNGKEEDAIIRQLRDIFERKGFLRHFISHWGSDVSVTTEEI